MKNLIIKYINVISLLGLMAFSFSATLTLNNKEIATKLQIETNLEKKVENVISKLYKPNQFTVTTNVQLLSATKNSNTNQTVQSFGALELEGILPAVPNTDNTTVVLDDSDYRIAIQDITIWLDYQLNVIDAENKIKQFLFEAMDWLAQCEGCIQFRSMQFPNANQVASQTNLSPNTDMMGVGYNNAGEYDATISNIEDNIESLFNILDELADNNEDDGISKEQWMIDNLVREQEEKKAEIKELRQETKDAWNQTLQHYQNSQSVDSLLKLELVQGNKEIALTAMDKEIKPDNTLLYVVLCILIGIILLLIILDKRGPKTVYLKPKNKKSDQTKNDKINNDVEPSESAPSSDHVSQTITPQPEVLDSTSAYQDDSVVQSDLKSMKQSAVKMSVGQKKGASQIVQDWLDDGNDTDDNNESTEEKSNE